LIIISADNRRCFGVRPKSNTNNEKLLQPVLEKTAILGADITTIPGSILPELWNHQLKSKEINQFSED